MRVLRRGRHARTPHFLSPLVLVVLAGASLGSMGFLRIAPAAPSPVPPAPAILAADLVPTPPPEPNREPVVLPDPPPGESQMAAIDTAWRDFDDSVDLRFALAGPVPGDHPPPPAGSGAGRRIVYANTEQRVWLLGDGGVVLDSYPVSGRSGIPLPGSYRVFSRSELAWAGHDGITMRYMVRFGRGSDGLAIGFHSIPLDRGGRPIQTEEDLGSFRSAGCVRQTLEKAVELYGFAETGTPVIVTP